MMKYYLFFKIDFKPEIKLKVVDKYSILLTEERIKRMFNYSKEIQNGFYKIWVVESNDEENISLIEFSQYFNDCNYEIKKVIDNNKIFGYSSRSQNKIIESIIDFESINNSSTIEKLHGEDGWNTLTEFFYCLNKSGIKYVSLRKNENLPEGFIDGDKDIDILCENKEELVKYFCLKKRSLGISGYQILLKQETIPIDVRFKGDYYFDSSWEQKILDSRELNNNNIFVMDKENQFFSIIYHVLTQKKQISKYYEGYLKKSEFYVEENDLVYYLAMFMQKNGYFFVKPTDLSVYQNKKNILKIKRFINNYNFLYILSVSIISKMPNILFFKNVKSYVLKKQNKRNK